MKEKNKETEDCRHQWAPLLAQVKKKTTPSLVKVCLRCGELKIGQRTIRMSRYRLDMGNLPIKNLGNRWGKANLEWTLDKLLKGAGAGADPTEIDVPATDFPKKLKPALTRYVVPGWYIYAQSTATVTAGRIYYIPIFVEETTTYIAIGVRVSTAVAGTADLRIYNWSDGVPGSLVLSAGTVDTGTTGAKEIIISQQLTRGYYFLALRCSAAPTFYGINSDCAVATPVAGLMTAGVPNANYIVLTVSAAYADPAPAPTGAEAGQHVCVYLREN